MGKMFRKTRNTILQNAMVVRSVLRSSLALFLHGNPQYANEVEMVLKPIIEALEDEEYDTEDMIHEAIEDAFMKIAKDKPIYVRAAITDLINTTFSLVSSKVEMDEDKVLSSEERKAWIMILEGMLNIANMVKKEEQDAF